MPDKLSLIAKSRMTPRERHLRSQLAQLVSSAGLIHASANPREKVCGKPGCRCARGERHRCLYLLRSEGKERRQLFIPRALEPKALQWVEGYHRLRELLEELSRIYWDKLQRREP